MVIDFTQWQPDPFLLADAPIIADYAEFSGEDAFDVANRVANFQKLTQPEFSTLGAGFYTQSKTYIYDILSGNPSAGVRANLMNKFIPNCVQRIKDHPGKDFLDFGAGVGAVCEIAYTFCDKRVHYMDIPSRSTDFAEWRFLKHGWKDIQMHIIREDQIDVHVDADIIFTDAVWEHLPPAKQLSYAGRLVDFLRPGGMLMFLVDLSGENPNMPMHYNVDIKQVHGILFDRGLACTHGLNTFASVWEKR